MDKKGFIIGVITKLKVIISKYNKNKYMTQYSNQEQVSLIKYVLIDSQALKLQIIFKVKLI